MLRYGGPRGPDGAALLFITTGVLRLCAMGERPTSASVTDLACTCGYLERASNDPDLPIRFESRDGGYQFNFPPAGECGLSMLVIYHCPFCGGATPRSNRELLFHAIPRVEEERLLNLLRPIESVEDALERLGEPDEDRRMGMASKLQEAEGRPGRIQYERTLRYRSLSEIAEVEIIEGAGGRVSFGLSGKRKVVPPS